MNNFDIFMLFNSLGYLAYASVLIYCSIANPPKGGVTRVMRVLTGLLAIVLGSNLLKVNNEDPQTMLVAFHSVFQLLVAVSAFDALKKKK